ncbi:MAG: ABC transporter permease [Alphaproteobacteria bacterium]|nr:ABC transporter permease [Alphaproteobacteria bacterium]
MKAALSPRAQAGVLTERYWSITLAEWPTALMLIAQAPFIGWLCQLVWASVETDTPSLRFVLALSAVWFGCINACREIVKERAILERERFFGLSLSGYVASKFAVLAVIGLVQVVLLQFTVEWSLSLRGAMPVQLLALWGASLCGAGLGLLVSAVSRSQSQAVAALIPILLPQILFSEVAVPRESFTRVVELVEKAMPVYWAYRVFKESAAVEPAWGVVLLSLGALVLYAGLLAAAATLALLPRRET